MEAELLYQRALAIREQHLGPEHPYTANALSNLANLYLAQRRYREAEPLYRRSLAIREQHFGPPHLDSDDHLHTLANFYVTQGWYREAESLYQRILAIREQRLGPLHYRTANILNNQSPCTGVFLLSASSNSVQHILIRRPACTIWPCFSVTKATLWRRSRYTNAP